MRTISLASIIWLLCVAIANSQEVVASSHVATTIFLEGSREPDGPRQLYRFTHNKYGDWEYGQVIFREDGSFTASVIMPDGRTRCVPPKGKTWRLLNRLRDKHHGKTVVMTNDKRIHAYAKDRQ